MDLAGNKIGVDGFNELLKFMELPEGRMRNNPGYKQIMEVRALDLIFRIQYTIFLKSYTFFTMFDVTYSLSVVFWDVILLLFNIYSTYLLIWHRSRKYRYGNELSAQTPT